MARRATPFNLKISKSKHRVKVSCSHDGYKRLKGKPVHTRKWVSEANQFLIHDSISGSIDSAEARYHFHPNIKVELDAFEKNGSVVLSDKRKIHFEVRDGKASIVKTTHHPEFGLSIDSKSLVVNFISAKSSIKFYW